MKRKAIATMMIFAFLALALVATVPCAQCARPPVSPWPPETKWDPMRPRDALPLPVDQWVWLEGDWAYSLTAEEPFLLVYGWICFPTNVMYTLDGERTTVPFSLQDHLDTANCIYTVTMDGALLKPTGQFTANVQWLSLIDFFGIWGVVPKAIWHTSYIEFPQGLNAGTYTIEVYGKPCWAEPFFWTVTLDVS